MASSKASEAPPQGTTSEESVRTLKKLVRSYLCRSEFASKVRTALSCPVEDAQRAEGSVTVTRRRTVEEAVAVLKNEGFVEELTKLAMMDAKRTSEEERSSATTNSDGGSCLMKVRVSGVEGLDDAATISGEGRAVATKVCIMWCGQRKWSVHKAAVGERIRGTNDTHFFNIPSKCSKNGAIDAEALGRLPTAMRVLVLRACEPGHEAAESQTPKIIGAACVDWTSSITIGGMASKEMKVEIMDPFVSTNIPVGSLRVRIGMHPALTDPGRSASARSIANHSAADMNASVLRYVDVAKLWWRDYCGVRERNVHRVVCLMAKSEFGQRLPVTCFLRLLRPGRSLPTPRDAARYVSLFDLDADGGASMAASRSMHSPSSTTAVVTEDVWCTMPTVIARKAGTMQELAILLCSLFLAFGLDAYVCLGRNSLGQRVSMVLTRPSGKKAVLWDPTSGKPYGGREAGEGAMSLSLAPMQRIHSCFNSEYVFANQQASDEVTSVSWSLEDAPRWASLHAAPLVGSVFGCDAVLFSSPIPPDRIELTEKRLERELRVAFFRRREEMGSGRGGLRQPFSDAGAPGSTGTAMLWDEKISTLLMPALEAYEQEARSGVTFGNSEFQQSIKRNTPVGHTFKGFPYHATHTDVRAIVAAMLEEPACAVILSTVKEGLRFALRCRVTSYPDDVLSVWIMLAVCHRGVEN